MTAFERIRAYHVVSQWQFVGASPSDVTELYCIAQALSTPADDARFLIALPDVVPLLTTSLPTREVPSQLPTLPVPPRGGLEPPFSLRCHEMPVALRRRSLTPAEALAWAAWVYYPELIFPDELADYCVSRSQAEGSGFRWTIQYRRGSLSLGLTVRSPSGGIVFRLEPIPADQALGAVSGHEIARALDALTI